MKTARILVILFSLFAVSILAGTSETLYSYKSDIYLQEGECWGCHCSIYQFMCTYEKFLAHRCTEDARTLGMLAVWPGRPDSSVTIWRLHGKLPSGEEIISMPYGLDKLRPEKIEVWEKWIEQGALETVVAVDDKKSWGEIKKMFEKE